MHPAYDAYDSFDLLPTLSVSVLRVSTLGKESFTRTENYKLGIFNHNMFSRKRFKSSFKEIRNLREGQEDADVLGKSILFASVVLKI